MSVGDEVVEKSGITPIEAARARERRGGPGPVEPEAEANAPRLWFPTDLAEEISRRAGEPWIPLEIEGRPS